MLTKEIKQCLKNEQKAKRKHKFLRAQQYHGIVMDLAKECRITESEFSYIFKGQVVTPELMYWLVVHARDTWKGAVDDGWVERQEASNV